METLTRLGLSETDAGVYLFLAKDGPKQGRSITKELGLYKQQLYRSLKRLQSKGLVTATLEHPAHFSAMSLEKVLDILIEARKEQALDLEASRKDLLSTWRSMVEKKSTEK